MLDLLVAMIKGFTSLDIILLIGIIYLVLKDTINKLLKRAKSVKVGPVEYEAKEEEPIRPEELLEQLRQENNKANEEIKGSLHHICENMKEIKSRLDSVDVNQMRLTFYNENIPEAQRVYSGLSYIHLGGNGSCKADVKRYIQEAEHTYEAICTLHPELRIEQDGTYPGKIFGIESEVTHGE